MKQRNGLTRWLEIQGFDQPIPACVTATFPDAFFWLDVVHWLACILSPVLISDALVWSSLCNRAQIIISLRLCYLGHCWINCHEDSKGENTNVWKNKQVGKITIVYPHSKNVSPFSQHLKGLMEKTVLGIFGLKWTLPKALKSLHVVSFRSVFFPLKFASFSRHYICKTLVFVFTLACDSKDVDFT